MTRAFPRSIGMGHTTWIYDVYRITGIADTNGVCHPSFPKERLVSSRM